MGKKLGLTVIILAVAVLTATYIYYNNDASPDLNSKTVDEDINGYHLEEDLQITAEIEQAADERSCCITQQQKMQLIGDLTPAPTVQIIEEYNDQLPATIQNAIAYPYYNIAYDYFLITAEEAIVREQANSTSPILTKIKKYEKVTLLQKVAGEQQENSNIWYRIAYENNEEIKFGYVKAADGVQRSFSFEKMELAIAELKQQVEQGELHFISNYKNYNGDPPLKGDVRVDEYGYRVYHSAPAYLQADSNSDFRYIPDGLLVRILNEVGDFYHVDVPTFGGQFYVPKQYIDPNNSLRELKHVVVVDRTQQNQAAFELKNEELSLVSYTLATTGFAGDYSFVTTLGSFKAIEKKDRFQYLKKGTSEIAGYAPYAIRFTGGAYIHGVPVAYNEQDGTKLDPGTKEYLHTIGTFPRSSMCVRNFTSHAEFLYNWMDIQNGAVIVIE